MMDGWMGIAVLKMSFCVGSEDDWKIGARIFCEEEKRRTHALGEENKNNVGGGNKRLIY